MRKKLFAWIGRNERHLSALGFIVSFIIDNIFYHRVDLPWITILFTGMFLVAAACIAGSHYLHKIQSDAAPSYRRPFYTILPIIAAFFTGGLLSGCFIFYTRSANFLTSWPFLILLAAVFFGNELFSRYRERLTFQVVQLFFGLYLYLIFEVPVLVGSISRTLFLVSGAASILVFALFLSVLWRLAKQRLRQSFNAIVGSIAFILVVVNISYFAHILPPLPLSLNDIGIYQSVAHTDAGYAVEGQLNTSGFLAEPVVDHVPGTPLFAYSAVFAPVNLTTPIVHEWDQYDATTNAWNQIARISFPVSGGRDGGYRGYSEVTDITPGQWRVIIETDTGAVLGELLFSVVDVSELPPLVTELK